MPVDIPKIIQEFSGQFKSEKMILRIYQQWSVRTYISYDAVRYFESYNRKKKKIAIQFRYLLYHQNIIAINHFKNQAIFLVTA
jgi:hypothetical protein